MILSPFFFFFFLYVSQVTWHWTLVRHLIYFNLHVEESCQEGKMNPLSPSRPGRTPLAAVLLCCARGGCAVSREWASIFHKPHVPRRYGALHTRMWGSAASAGHGFVLLFLFVFFTSVIILTQCTISALCTLLLLVIIKIRPWTFSLQRKRELCPVGRSQGIRQCCSLFSRAKKPKVCGNQGYADVRTLTGFSLVWMEIRCFDMRFLVSASS